MLTATFPSGAAIVLNILSKLPIHAPRRLLGHELNPRVDQASEAIPHPQGGAKPLKPESHDKPNGRYWRDPPTPVMRPAVRGAVHPCVSPRYVCSVTLLGGGGWTPN